MDISHDLKKLKRKLEHGLEKQSHANSVQTGNEKTIEVNGKTYELPPDFDELQEIDYNNPEVKKWLAELEAESIRKYGKLTYEEAEYMYARRIMLKEEFSNKSTEELNQMALVEFRTGQRKTIPKNLKDKIPCENGEYEEIAIERFLTTLKLG